MIAAIGRKILSVYSAIFVLACLTALFLRFEIFVEYRGKYRLFFPGETFKLIDKDGVFHKATSGDHNLVKHAGSDIWYSCSDTFSALIGNFYFKASRSRAFKFIQKLFGLYETRSKANTYFNG